MPFKYSRASGHYSQAMTIVSESVPMAKRNVVVLLVGSLFLLAQGIMAGNKNIGTHQIPRAVNYK